MHTIQGMPNAAKTAYLATIERNNVRAVKLWKAGYFSTSFIHFVWIQYQNIKSINFKK